MLTATRRNKATKRELIPEDIFLLLAVESFTKTDEDANGFFDKRVGEEFVSEITFGDTTFVYKSCQPLCLNYLSDIDSRGSFGES